MHGGVSDTWNTDRPNYTGDVVLNIPLIAGRAALRLSGFYDSEAGFLKRRYCTDPATANVTCFPQTSDPALTTTVNNIAATDEYGVAASLGFKVTDNLTVTPRFMQQRESYNGFPMTDVLTDPRADRLSLPGRARRPSRCRSSRPSDFTQGRFFNFPEGGFDAWHLYSLNIKWNTGIGELVSASAYFDRKVIEDEDQTDFVWTALLPAVSANPAFGLPRANPERGSEEKDYQRFVQEVRFVSALPGPAAIRRGRLLFRSAWASAVCRLLSARHDAGIRCALKCGRHLRPRWVVYRTRQTRTRCSATNYHTRLSVNRRVFGEVSYEITQAFKATAGLRWSQVKTTAGGFQEAV